MSVFHDVTPSLNLMFSRSKFRSVTKWNNAMTSFESVYHEAYELATEETAKNISSTPVQNWGAPPLLPQIPYNPRSNHDITKQFVKDQSTWEMNELLRPMYLQYNLVGDYHDSIHARAFELMTIAKSLPFAIDSKAFYFAYSAFYARMGISTQCCTFFLFLPLDFAGITLTMMELCSEDHEGDQVHRQAILCCSSTSGFESSKTHRSVEYLLW